MTRNQLIEFISEVETAIPVAQWVVNDIHIWSYIRVQLEVHLTKERPEPESVKITAGAQLRPTRYRTIRKFLSALYYYLRQRYFNTRKVDVICCGGPEHRGDFEGVFMNKLLDPLVEMSGDDPVTFGYLELEVLEGRNYFTSEKIRFMFDLSKFLPAMALLVRFSKRNVHLLRYEEFIRVLKTKTDDEEVLKNFASEEMIHTMLVMQLYANLLQGILKKAGPKAVISVCYYGFSRMALNIAANRLGIITVDMQHGAQGKMHPAYGNWQAVPASGFEMLPRYFWCWDEESAQDINLWTNKKKDQEAFSGGHPWVWFCSRAGQSILKKLNKKMPVGNRKLILYTLQPLIESFPGFLVSAIQQTGDRFLWLIRFHPRQENKEELVGFLNQDMFKNQVEYQLSSEIPLPLILQQSALHLTMFSGAIVESKMFSVPTILMDRRGKELFPELLENNLNYYFDPALAELNFVDFIDDVLQKGKLTGNRRNDIQTGIQKFKSWVNG